MNPNTAPPADWLTRVSQPPPNGRSPISNVPREVFLVLMESLDCDGLCGMRGTCRELRDLVDKEFPQKHYPTLEAGFSMVGLRQLEKFATTTVFGPVLPSLIFNVSAFRATDYLPEAELWVEDHAGNVRARQRAVTDAFVPRLAAVLRRLPRLEEIELRDAFFDPWWAAHVAAAGTEPVASWAVHVLSRALLLAAADADVRLKHLTVLGDDFHMPGSVRSRRRRLPGALDAGGLAGLESLCVGLPLNVDDEAEYESLLEVIHGLPGVGTLALANAHGGFWRGTAVGANHLAAAVRLPNLREVSVTGLEVEARPVKRLLLRHAATLRRVYVAECFELDECCRLDCEPEIRDFAAERLALDPGQPVIVCDPDHFSS
ncbi:hypothetical protein SLS58_005045 [Diplodia intermedia]|uniref:F-box domain-containing protein n=1 Tax=Diplodia intermedia TaxID=856260 RepID=A0ABR3TRS0_9PEZI